jgi:tetratricopeptide (TPR) repeat protein
MVESDMSLADDQRVKALLLEGRKHEALQWCKSQVATSGTNPHLHYLMGVSATATGEYTLAIEAFHKALNLAPKEPKFLVGLARTYLALSRQNQAIPLLYRALWIYPKNAEIYALLGQAYALADKRFRAIFFCKKSLRLQPPQAGTLSTLGNLYERTGKKALAEACYRTALRYNPTLKEANRSLGLIFYRKRHYEEAITHLKRALQESTHDAHGLFALAHSQAKTGMTNDAIATYRKALLIQPHNPAIHCQLGELLREKRLYDEALHAYQAAIDIEEHYVPAYVMRTTLLIHMNRITEAEATLFHAREVGVSEQSLLLPYVFLHTQQGNFSQAETFLRGALNKKNVPEHQALFQHHLGNLLEKQGFYDSAFDYYLASKTSFMQTRNVAHLDATQPYATVEAYEQWLKEHKPSAPIKRRFEDNVPTPTFLIGFPQSGIGLAEQILFTHSGIIATQNAPIIDDMFHHAMRILGRPISLPESLTVLTDEAILQLRHYYAERLYALLGKSAARQHIVDKNPLNIIHLPLISRLFPDAKIIMLVRDPRDVCINCMSHLFPSSNIALSYTNLDATTALYARVMGLYLQYKSLLPLHITEIRYESMVQDVKPHAKQLVNLTGVAWEEDIVHYYEDVKNTRIDSPMETSIFQPVYNREVGRWRHFSRQLLPYLNRLEGCLREWGY